MVQVCRETKNFIDQTNPCSWILVFVCLLLLCKIETMYFSYIRNSILRHRVRPLLIFLFITRNRVFFPTDRSCETRAKNCWNCCNLIQWSFPRQLFLNNLNFMGKYLYFFAYRQTGRRLSSVLLSDMRGILFWYNLWTTFPWLNNIARSAPWRIQLEKASPSTFLSQKFNV